MFEKYMALMIFEVVLSVKYCIVFYNLCQYERVTSFRVIYLVSLTKSHTNFATSYSQKMVFQIWVFKIVFNVSYCGIKGLTDFFGRSSYNLLGCGN